MKTLIITLSFLFMTHLQAAIVTCPTNDNSAVKDIALFDGEPKENVRLAPTRETSPQYWVFAKSKARPIWMACYYGKREVANFKQLPADIVKCTRTSVSTMDCI